MMSKPFMRIDRVSGKWICRGERPFCSTIAASNCPFLAFMGYMDCLMREMDK